MMRFTGVWSTIIMVMAVQVCAQPDTLWTRVYGGPEFDRSLGALALEDGFFVTGLTESYGAGFRDVWLLRLDENGDTLWARTYGDPYEDVGSSILPAAGGGYWLSGRTMLTDSTSRDWLLMKIDENGDSLCSCTFGSEGGDWGGRSYPTTDGGLILTGQWADTALGAQMGIIKLDAIGDSVWGRHYGGAAYESCNDAFQTEDGGYILAGMTESFSAGERDFWLLRLDANGDSLWSNHFGGELMERCYGIQQADDGGYVLVGTTWSFGAGEADMWLVKTSATGDSLWSRTYGGEFDDDARDLCRSPDGGFVLAGFSRATDATQAVLLRVNAEGDSLWSQLTGSAEDDDRHSWIKPLPDGGYLAGGLRLNHPEEHDDFWIIRTGPDPVRHPPGPFMRLLPEDSLFTGDQSPIVSLIWTSSIDIDGDTIQYLLHFSSPTYGFPFPIDTVLNDTIFEIEIGWVDEPCGSTDEIFEFFWTVYATDGDDTVEASNGEGYFLVERSGAADDVLNEIPENYRLSVYPNPFNPTATLRFTLPVAQHVSLVLYDVRGRWISSIERGHYSAGTHTLAVDASGLPSGMYLVRMTTATHSLSQRLFLVR